MTVYTHFFIKLFSASSIAWCSSFSQTDTDTNKMAWHKGTWWPLAVKVKTSLYKCSFMKRRLGSFGHQHFISGVVRAQGLPAYVWSIQVRLSFHDDSYPECVFKNHVIFCSLTLLVLGLVFHLLWGTDDIDNWVSGKLEASGKLFHRWDWVSLLRWGVLQSGLQKEGIPYLSYAGTEKLL